MVLAMAGLVVAIAATAPVDVKGKWEGTIAGQRGDGTIAEDGALLILEQKGTTITGTVGGSETDQHPIVSGSIDGNKLKLIAERRNDGRQLTLELTVEGNEMKGTIAVGERRGQIAVKRRKD